MVLKTPREKREGGQRYENYRNGNRICGDCKKELAEKVKKF